MGIGLVDLVDRDDDRDVGSLGVVDGFKRLRHHAVVGCDHDDDNIRDLGAASAHAGKGFVTRSIEEDDLAARSRRILLGELHLVGADVLSDAAGFAGGDVGLANGVEQRSLTVIDVTHDGDDWRTRDFELVEVILLQQLFDRPRWPSDLRS